MKKLTFILFTIFAFVSSDIVAQWTDSGSGRINRTGGADRASDVSSIFATQGDWSTDAMISQYTSAQTLSGEQSWEGTSHVGMGASGWGSTAVGAYNRASGVGAFVSGFMNVAGPTSSSITAIPPSTTNLGGQFAVGYATTATGHTAFTSGYSTIASGNYSTAMGIGATASDYGSFVIGSYNSSGSSATSAASFSTSAPAFVIGNGTASNAKSDAFKVLFNGNTTVAGDIIVTGNDMTFGNGETISNASDGTVTITSGTVSLSSNATIGNDLTVSGDIVVSSDARLKANIVSLGSTLARLLLIDGKTYTMKKDGKQKIGVLAQDIQNVFPELVSEDDNEMLAVNYQGLVPVLINALKEQDDKISRLEVLVEKLMSDK
tara:strand:- start:1920 stop:3050 length:1131 start_codon:yes stop_codon:yes gene_type:complete